MSEHTKSPWEWHKVGKNWVLWGAHGHRPIVLDVFKGKLRLRNAEQCLMIPFDPDHPDARLIEAAAELLETLKDVLAGGVEWDGPTVGYVTLQVSRQALSDAYGLIARLTVP